MPALNKIYITHLLDMGDTELTNWLIENKSEYYLVKRSELAEHDKQVVVDFNEFVKSLDSINGIDKLMVKTLVIKYINHLKDK